MAQNQKIPFSKQPTPGIKGNQHAIMMEFVSALMGFPFSEDHLLKNHDNHVIPSISSITGTAK